MNDLSLFLMENYGIDVVSILSVKGGWSTKAAYRVTGDDGIEYFVKIYDKRLPTISSIIDRIAVYMPVLDWLSKTPGLYGRILTPVRALNGDYRAETDEDIITIFLFIDGGTVGIYKLSVEQTIELAETLAKLHEVSIDKSIVTSELNEDISLSFCERLIDFLDSPEEVANFENNNLVALISSNIKVLRKAAVEALNLRDTLRVGYPQLVFIHGDAHGNNIIQGEHLVLADWDDLRVAPAEADLFISDWHNHGEILLEAYSRFRNGYEINRELLDFYVLRRRIEDLWVDIERLTKESPDEVEAATLLDWVSQSIEGIRELIK